VIIRAGVAVLLLLPTAAFAQGTPGPFGGLFGRTPERSGREFTQLIFRTGSGVQFAQTLEDDPIDIDPDGLSAGVDAGFNLDHVRDRWQAIAHGRGMYQHFNADPLLAAITYDGGGQLVAKATNRITFDVSGRVTRSPFFHMLPVTSPAIEQVAIPGEPFAAGRIDNDTFETVAGMTSQYSKRSSVSAWASWRATRFHLERASDFSARGVRAQWRRNLNRDFTARVGYGREQIRQRGDSDDRFMHELIDIGVDYLRSLSVARRTSLSVLTETSVLRENAGKRRYRLNGAAELLHLFKRTWRTSIGAHRATEFLPGFDQPLFSDTARASIAGLFSNRLSVNANVYGGQSQIGFDNPGRFLTYSGDARLTYALTRHFGVFTQYAYYHYQLPRDSQAAVLLPRLSRQFVTVGVQTWLPLVNKEKARDPR
jgi:hypothetical protein